MNSKENFKSQDIINKGSRLMALAALTGACASQPAGQPETQAVEPVQPDPTRAPEGGVNSTDAPRPSDYSRLLFEAQKNYCIAKQRCGDENPGCVAGCEIDAFRNLQTRCWSSGDSEGLQDFCSEKEERVYSYVDAYRDSLMTLCKAEVDCDWKKEGNVCAPKCEKQVFEQMQERCKENPAGMKEFCEQ